VKVYTGLSLGEAIKGEMRTAERERCAALCLLRATLEGYPRYSSGWQSATKGIEGVYLQEPFTDNNDMHCVGCKKRARKAAQGVHRMSCGDENKNTINFV
jgi:hypothetical protein